METRTFSELDKEIKRNKNIKTNHLLPKQLTNNEDNNGERVSSPLPPVNRLCEDELSLIFSNLCITTRDLLNFRTVNKNWRDAATTILLRRDACYVAVGKISVAEQDKRDIKKCGCNSFFCQYEDKKATMTELIKLTNLIHNSQKFPSSNLHLRSCWNSVINFTDFPDLVSFLKLHRAKFKTLAPHGSVSTEYFQNIFSNIECKLECLDLASAKLTLSDKKLGSNKIGGSASTSKSKVLPLKTLILGYSYTESPKEVGEVINLLLSIPSKLNYITLVQPSHLAYVLKEKKGSLVQNFTYYFEKDRYDFSTSVSLMNEFADINPKLSKLTLHVNIGDDTYLATLTSINAIIESSKETLQNLQIIAMGTSYSENKLKIPPLNNLKCITLAKYFSFSPEEEDAIGNENKSMFVLQGHVQEENYFPNLKEVILKYEDFSMKKSHMFFIKPGSNRIQCLPKVEILDLQNSTLPSIPDAKLISAVFPNIRILKLTLDWRNTKKLNSSFWLLCPLVEFIEIHYITIEINELTKKLTVASDAFFTGFCPSTCQKLQKMELPEHMHSSEILDFLRINPSICDLRCLKELKLKFKFQKDLMHFTSYLTLGYAFSLMANTKFIAYFGTDPTDYYYKTSPCPEKLSSWISSYRNSADSLKGTATKTGSANKTIIKTNILQSNGVNDWPQVTPLQTTTTTTSFFNALPLILRHSCISTSDLLTYRLVSKVWRDMATEILLERGTCCVSLKLLREWSDIVNRFVCKSGDKNTKLETLTELISNSPRFPTCNVHIDSTSSLYSKYFEYADLRQFFKLHGNKIKTLRPIGYMNAQNLKSIVLYDVPNLECLDLSETELESMSTDYYTTEFLKQIFIDRLRLGIRPLKSLIFSFNFGYDVEAYGQVIHMLLSSYSNLSSIKNVNLSTLPHILKEEKGHLIKDLEYIMPYDYSETDVSLLKTFSTLNPKLSNLFLTVSNTKMYSALLPSINAILKSSKDTLQELELAVDPMEYWNKLRIPPMKNLKSLTWNAKFCFDPDDPEPHLRFLHPKPVETEEQYLGSAEDGLSGGENPFPNLTKVVLRQELRHIAEYYYFIHFLQFKFDKNETKYITCLPTVRKLELHGIFTGWQNNNFTKRVSKLFPNVRVLKIAWDEEHGFLSCLWGMCPLVELMEIYDVFSNEKDNDAPTNIDRFFTGFSYEMCRKLRTADEIPQNMDKPETWDFLRNYGSICHLRYLKEFKLTFLKDSLTQFASRVTGEFAFAQMPCTKFIISYDPKLFFEDVEQAEDDHEKLCFSSIRPYAQVVREERIEYKLKN